ncbi:unnamed protein product [Mytilus coruscus]|uniref:Uncharacterized protein n=1 Tax=Mytilus coruscus TaxID=42192 RepID=A0A6J8C823_MYTCO|nr:unnamed protein product [Mytilus coruscus]
MAQTGNTQAKVASGTTKKKVTQQTKLGENQKKLPDPPAPPPSASQSTSLGKTLHDNATRKRRNTKLPSPSLLTGRSCSLRRLSGSPCYSRSRSQSFRSDRSSKSVRGQRSRSSTRRQRSRSSGHKRSRRQRSRSPRHNRSRSRSSRHHIQRSRSRSLRHLGSQLFSRCTYSRSTSRNRQRYRSRSPFQRSRGGKHSSQQKKNTNSERQERNVAQSFPLSEEKYQRRMLYILTEIRDLLKKDYIRGQMEYRFQQIDEIDILKEKDIQLGEEKDCGEIWVYDDGLINHDVVKTQALVYGASEVFD